MSRGRGPIDLYIMYLIVKNEKCMFGDSQLWKIQYIQREIRPQPIQQNSRGAVVSKIINQIQYTS
jgi:hypothetical protein